MGNDNIEVLDQNTVTSIPEVSPVTVTPVTVNPVPVTEPTTPTVSALQAAVTQVTAVSPVTQVTNNVAPVVPVVNNAIPSVAPPVTQNTIVTQREEVANPESLNLVDELAELKNQMAIMNEKLTVFEKMEKRRKIMSVVKVVFRLIIILASVYFGIKGYEYLKDELPNIINEKIKDIDISNLKLY